MLSKLLSIFNKVRGKKNNYISLDNVIFSKLIVLGFKNKVKLNGKSFIKKVNVKIEGEGNTLVIEDARDIRDVEVVIKGNGNKVLIGKNCGVAKSRIVCFGDNKSITIGEDCMIADYCEIWNCDTHSIIDVKTGERINPAGDIFISNKVWLGMRATILKNSKIETGTIVGSSSLCKSEVYNANCIYAGSPAKLVKEGVTWDRELK